MLIQESDLDAVHVEAIDRQHRAIASLVNDIHKAMEEGKGKEALVALIEALIEATRRHFADEERLMAAYRYPDRLRHRNEHRRLLEHVLTLYRRFKEGEIVLSLAILMDLKAWATRHVARSDRPLGAFLRSRGVR